MTRTDTTPTAAEQNSTRCICWDDPDDDSDRYCQHCEDLLDEHERRDHERAVAKAWDQAHAEQAARQASPHD
jgi:hypothetical protein